MSTVLLVLFGACISAVSVPLPSMLCSLAQWFWVLDRSEACQPPDSSLRGWYKWDEVKKSIQVTPGAVGWIWRNTLNTWCGRADINVGNTAVPQRGAQFRWSRPPCWLLRAQADFRWRFKVHREQQRSQKLRSEEAARPVWVRRSSLTCTERTSITEEKVTGGSRTSDSASDAALGSLVKAEVTLRVCESCWCWHSLVLIFLVWTFQRG